MANDEPMFEAGAFHVELIAGAFGVYDAYVNRVHLYFATREDAEDATSRLAVAASTSSHDLDTEYARLVVRARASLETA